MKDMHGILFAHSSGANLKELTEHRTASSLPFGARYRVVDFMLSGMVGAGVSDVGVIMRENYQSLLDHLGSGKDWDLSRKRGGLRLLPPFAYAGGRRDVSAYRGKLEALYAVMRYISYIRQEYVVLADGDLIANLPLEEIFQKHLAKGADITCVCAAGDFGGDSDIYIRPGAGEIASEVLLHCLDPDVYPGIGVYILSKALLERLLADCAAHNYVDFARDVMQRLHGQLKIYTYLHDGFATKIQSVSDYFARSMSLLRHEIRRDLFNPNRPIKTKMRDDPPAYYSPESRVSKSIAADGCVLKGKVSNCIIFRGVHIDEGAVVSDCILMQDTRIEKGATLSHVICDKEVVVGSGKSLQGLKTYPVAISKGMEI